jgi:hypothetical protein
MTLVGYKGLPQCSVLSPFLYNIIGSSADRFIPSGCEFFQFADDLVVCMAHRLFNLAHGLVQTACTSFNVFFSSMGLTISASKSKVMLFTKKHERSSILVRIGSYVLPQRRHVSNVWVYFRCWVEMDLPFEICTTEMPPKCELVEISGRWFLGSASILFDIAV